METRKRLVDQAALDVAQNHFKSSQKLQDISDSYKQKLQAIL